MGCVMILGTTIWRTKAGHREANERQRKKEKSKSVREEQSREKRWSKKAGSNVRLTDCA